MRKMILFWTLTCKKQFIQSNQGSEKGESGLSLTTRNAMADAGPQGII